mmetsp:Transcript_6893/g.24343  ORF Transcript_6893/g.24343 Transcript_6893/m.24343 type:complete len:315 (-) Transcript_6893:364-1308(-)
MHAVSAESGGSGPDSGAMMSSASPQRPPRASFTATVARSTPLGATPADRMRPKTPRSPSTSASRAAAFTSGAYVYTSQATPSRPISSTVSEASSPRPSSTWSATTLFQACELGVAPMERSVSRPHLALSTSRTALAVPTRYVAVYSSGVSPSSPHRRTAAWAASQSLPRWHAASTRFTSSTTTAPPPSDASTSASSAPDAPAASPDLAYSPSAARSTPASASTPAKPIHSSARLARSPRLRSSRFVAADRIAATASHAPSPPPAADSSASSHLGATPEANGPRTTPASSSGGAPAPRASSRRARACMGSLRRAA